MLAIKKKKRKSDTFQHVSILFPELPPPVRTEDGDLVLSRSLEHQGIIVLLKDTPPIGEEAAAAFRIVCANSQHHSAACFIPNLKIFNLLAFDGAAQVQMAQNWSNLQQCEGNLAVQTNNQDMNKGIPARPSCQHFSCSPQTFHL